MLLISIPKSASSSLQAYINRFHFRKRIDKVRIKNHYFPDKNVLDFQLNDSSFLYREHIFPNTSNLKYLRGKKKVVLLRSPEDCRKAVLRAKKEKVNNSYDFLFNFDYDLFYEKWFSFDIDNTLFLFYDDLIKTPTKEVNKLEDFFKLPRSNKVVLPKVYYTRSKIHTLGRNFNLFFRNIKKKIKIKYNLIHL